MNRRWHGRANGGAEASAGTFADAAAYGELVVFATKGVADGDVVAEAGADKFAGKVVIDATNPLDLSAGHPDLAIKGDDLGGEALQRALPGARVVKAFNIVNYSLMFRPELPGGPPDMFIAGDDMAAKETVREDPHRFRLAGDRPWRHPLGALARGDVHGLGDGRHGNAELAAGFQDVAGVIALSVPSNDRLNRPACVCSLPVLFVTFQPERLGGG